MKITRCTRCVMLNTRPGIVFNEEGVCSACLNHEHKQSVNWEERGQELKALLDEHRDLKPYNCIIPVSGGKDSHVQVKVLKEQFGMNPLLVSVGNLAWSHWGTHNAQNMLEHYDCECVTLSLSPKTSRKLLWYCLKEHGSPTWYWDRQVYTYPLVLAGKLGIPLVFYGENIAREYGGWGDQETPDAKSQLINSVADARDLDALARATGVDVKRLNAWEAGGINWEAVEPKYLSYYQSWSGWENWQTAKGDGFKAPVDDPFWFRQGFIEDYDQIDAAGYPVHCWMKYPKYGHQRVTDVASIWVREGRLTRPQAMEIVKKYDARLDVRIFEDFCGYIQMRPEVVYEVIKGQFNRTLFNYIDYEEMPYEQAREDGWVGFPFELKEETKCLTNEPSLA